jgi:2'-5' RNA ligase/predicted ABC-type ATPase/GNAT superfamily N-acetyltransferase
MGTGLVGFGQAMANLADQLGQTDAESFKKGPSLAGGPVTTTPKTERTLTAYADKYLEPLAQKMEAIEESLTPQNPGLYDDLVNAATSMALFMVPAMGTAKAASMIGRFAPYMARLFGEGAMVGLESMQQAGDDYRQMVAEGMTPDQAARRSAVSFVSNTMLLAFTNHWGIFGEVKGKGIVAKAKRTAATIGSEGGQEAGQQAISTAIPSQDLEDALDRLKAGAGDIAYQGVIGGIVAAPAGALAHHGMPPTRREAQEQYEAAPGSAAGYVTPLRTILSTEIAAKIAARPELAPAEKARAEAEFQQAVAKPPAEEPPPPPPPPPTAAPVGKQAEQASPEAAAAVEVPVEKPVEKPAEPPEEQPQPKFEHSSTQVNLPDEMSGNVRAFADTIPDAELAEKGREETPHATVRFGLHDEDPGPIRDKLAGSEAVQVTLGPLNIFKQEGYDVLYSEVRSADLKRLNTELGNLPNTNEHGEYVPHVTIAYLKPGMGDKYVGISPPFAGMRALIDTVQFSSKSGQTTDIPLGATPQAQPETVPAAPAAPAIEEKAAQQAPQAAAVQAQPVTRKKAVKTAAKTQGAQPIPPATPAVLPAPKQAVQAQQPPAQAPKQAPAQPTTREQAMNTVGAHPTNPWWLGEFVRAKGGIAMSPTQDLKGEYAPVPFRYKNKNGLSPARMAEAVQEVTGQPYTDAQLLSDLGRLNLSKQEWETRVQREQADTFGDEVIDTETIAVPAASDIITTMTEGGPQSHDLVEAIAEQVDAAGGVPELLDLIYRQGEDAQYTTPGGRTLSGADMRKLLEYALPSAEGGTNVEVAQERGGKENPEEPRSQVQGPPAGPEHVGREAQARREAPAEAVPAEVEKPKPYYSALEEKPREALFAVMRKLDTEAERLENVARKNQGPFGTIPVGAAHFDDMLRSLAPGEYVRGLRKGMDPSEALASAKAEMRAAVEKHNKNRPKDINWKRDINSGQDRLLAIHRQVMEAVKVEQPTVVREAGGRQLPEISFQNDVLGVSHGQTDGTLRAMRGDTQVGHIDWASYRGKTYIQYIHVEPDARRQGVGKSLVEELQKGDEPVIWTSTTPEGEALRKAVGGEFAGNPETLEVSTPYDTPEIVAARQEQAAKEPTDEINTIERRQMRDGWADQLYGDGQTVRMWERGALANTDEGTRGKDKILAVVLGGPASGKTDHLAEPLQDRLSALLIDSDIVKLMIPESENGRFNGAVHMESSAVADDVYDHAVSQGDNIVYVLTGKNPDRITQVLNKAKMNGYRVHLAYMALPEEKAAQRAVDRYMNRLQRGEPTQFVDPAYVLEVDARPAATYDALKNDTERVDSYEAWNNDVPRGQRPTQTETGGTFPTRGRLGTSAETQGNGREDIGSLEGKAGLRYEQTPIGEQALVPGVAPRQMPATPLKAGVQQKGFEQTPLGRGSLEEKQNQMLLFEPISPYNRSGSHADNFRQWFGNSHVRNENGDPRVVYHGTGNPGFEEVNPEKFDPGALYGPGFYMTESPNIAGGVVEEDTEVKYFPTQEEAMAAPGRKGFVWSVGQGPIEERQWAASIHTPTFQRRGYAHKGLDVGVADQDERNRVVSELKSSRDWSRGMIERGYLSQGEQQRVDNNVQRFLETGQYAWLDELSGQPYNMRVIQKILERERGVGGVYALYARLENPFQADDTLMTGRQVSDIVDSLPGYVQQEFYESMFPEFTITEALTMLREGMDKPYARGAQVWDALTDAWRANGNEFSTGQANQSLRNAGYDGITHIGGQRTGSPEHRVWIAFNPGQIKSALGNRGSYDSAQHSMLAEAAQEYGVRREPGPVFYSGLKDLIETKLPTRASVDQLRAILRSNEVKQDEVKWSGLDDWLRDKTGPVTKQDVVNFLDANAVKVDEVVYGMAPPELLAKKETIEAAHSAAHREYVSAKGDIWRAVDPLVSGYRADQIMDDLSAGADNQMVHRGLKNLRAALYTGTDSMLINGVPSPPIQAVEDRLAALTDRFFETRDRVADLSRDLNQAARDISNAGQGLKYAAYVLPGAKNGRELLLTLGNVSPLNPNESAELHGLNRKALEEMTQDQFERWVELTHANQPTDDRRIKEAILKRADQAKATAAITLDQNAAGVPQLLKANLLLGYHTNEARSIRYSIPIPGVQESAQGQIRSDLNEFYKWMMLYEQAVSVSDEQPIRGLPAEAVSAGITWHNKMQGADVFDVFDDKGRPIGSYLARDRMDAIIQAETQGPNGFIKTGARLSAEDAASRVNNGGEVLALNRNGNVFEFFRGHAGHVADMVKDGTRFYESPAPTVSKRKPVVFESAHWDAPNILVHTRFNDRTDPEGRRTLHIEELQSDWHQKGRKQGYRRELTIPEIAQIKALQQSFDQERAEYETLIGRRGAEQAEPDEIRSRHKSLVEKEDMIHKLQDVGKTGVPDAPFAKTWHELAFKRVLRWAAENGYDRVSWTTGAQQNERYSISHVINSVTWANTLRGEHQPMVVLGKQGGGGDIKFLVGSDGKVLASTANRGAERFVGHQVDDVLPKPIAARIVGEAQGYIAGDGLEVGGEGMRGFYDKILKDFAVKYGKKWGAKYSMVEVDRPNLVFLGPVSDAEKAAKPWVTLTGSGTVVGQYATRREAQSALDRGNGQWMDNLIDPISKGHPVHSLEVTTAMRESVLDRGQALFERVQDYKKRKDASARTNQLTMDALWDLQAVQATPEDSFKSMAPSSAIWPKGVKVLGLGIRADLVQTGKLDWIGRKIEGHRQLAEMAQVLRDPRYETFRILYTKQGRLVGWTPVSSRLAAVTLAFEGNGTNAEGMARMKATMKDLGADGYWMMHNHPSGNPAVSQDDVNMTTTISGEVPGFQGHVVIDSGTYAVISSGARTPEMATIHKLPGTGPDTLLTPLVEHKLLNADVGTPQAMAAVAGQIVHGHQEIVLVYSDARNKVRAIQTLPLAEYNSGPEFRQWLQDQKRGFGAMRALVYTDSLWAGTDQISRTLIKNGNITDHVWRSPVTGAAGSEAVRTNVERGLEYGEKVTGYAVERERLTGVLPAARAAEARPGETGLMAREPTEDRRRQIQEEVGRRIRERTLARQQELSQAVQKSLPAPGETSPDPLVANPQNMQGAQPGALSQADVNVVDPILALGEHSQVLAVAKDLFTAAGVARDPDMLISDQIRNLMEDGKLTSDHLQSVRAKFGLTDTEFADALFRDAVRDAARRLGALGRLAQAIKRADPQIRAALDEVAEKQGLKEVMREQEIQRRWWNRLNNIRRGLLTTRWATGTHNFWGQNVRVGLDIADVGLQRMIQAGVKGLGGKIDPSRMADPSAAMHQLIDMWFRPGQRGTALQGPSKNEAEIRAILAAFPKEFSRAFSTYGSNELYKKAAGGSQARLDRILDGMDQGVSLLNIVNNWQENAFRNAILHAELDRLTTLRGKDLETLIKGNRADEIHLDDVKAAIQKSLELTFAESPEHGSVPWLFMNLVNRFLPLSFVIPFPRFMLNTLKFYGKFNPLGFLSLLSKAERAEFAKGNFRAISHSLMGAMLLGLSYALRDSDWAGDKWYEVNVGGHNIDITPYNPFAAYLFVGDLMVRARRGTLYNIDSWSILRGILSVNMRAGVGMALVDQLFKGLGDLDTEGMKGRLTGKLFGEAVAGLLVPLKNIQETMAIFSDKFATQRDPSLEPFLGPIKATTPFAAETLPERIAPTTGEVSKRRMPIAGMLGATVTQPKNDAERELDRLGFESREILPTIGIPEWDRMVKEEMGPLVEERIDPYVSSSAYQSLTDAEQREALAKKLREVRGVANSRVRAQDPELWKEMKMKKMGPVKRMIMEEHGR